MNVNKRLTVIDFFCGAGGFSEGFRRAGFDVVMGIDNWQPAIDTHNLNQGLNDSVRSVLDFEDIEEIRKLPDTDVIIGSPPCVLFSLSNHGGNADKDLGIRLIKAFYRVIAVKKHQKGSILKAWLMENVPNSRNYVDPHYTFADLNLTEWAESEGLNPKDIAINVKDNGAVLHSDNYGSGQIRKRFVCGEITGDGSNDFPLPDKKQSAPPTLKTLFNDFPKSIGRKYRDTDKVVDPNYKNETITVRQLHDHFYDTGVYEIEWKKARNAKINHPYMGKMSFPENQDKPSRTIMATRSASTREAILYETAATRKGDGEFRSPTVREAAIIMGFPITYQFTGNDESTKWRQVGNAVCVQLSFALAEKIKEKLKVSLPEAKAINKNLKSVNFLDNPAPKSFNKPPKRNPDALFREHPIKSGNMTTDLTNKVNGNLGEWGVVSYVGTGEGYVSVVIDKNYQNAAKKILKDVAPEYIALINSDSYIKKYSSKQLDDKNKEYGFVGDDKSHPYNIIQRISGYIADIISDDDKIIDTSNSILKNIKIMMPISQVMSIYAESVIVNGK